MAEKRKWAVAHVATKLKPSGSQNIEFGVTFVDAASEFEAEGLMLAIVRKLYPPADGWRDHHVRARDAATECVTLDNCGLGPSR